MRLKECGIRPALNLTRFSLRKVCGVLHPRPRPWPALALA